MEYVQTVLVQIEAAKLSEASRSGGLLPALDEHRSFLERQPGFLDMRVTRSINPQGNVLLVIETRWQDDHSLVQYETREPNVASIISAHQALVVPDSLQVLDMEALRPGVAPEHPAAETGRRLALPLLVPLGVLAFALLVIYGLSRIYLEIPSDVATGLAAGIAFGILAVSWYVATHPRIQAWQIASILVVAAAALAGGAIFALVREDDGEATAETPEAVASPTAEGTAPPGEAPGELLLTMGDNFFEFEGERGPTIQVPLGEEVTFDLTNGGLAIHDMHVAGTDNEYGVLFCETGGEEPCSDPELFQPGDTGTITLGFDEPGLFVFRCDFHPIEMIGQLEVR